MLTPWNYILSTDEGYRADYEALVEEIRRQDAGLMIIKTISRRNWPDGDQRYTTWYEPFDQQEHVDAAISWVLVIIVNIFATIFLWLLSRRER